MLIDGWKNRGLFPDKVPQAEGYAYGNGLGAKLYADYQARMKIINAADFGDLLLEPLRMFQENPDVLKTYQERFKYMLVDEYQDTNVAQYLWLRLLAQGHKNICCVGDDDQSIYGWRGAEVDNILRFEKDFPRRQGHSLGAKLSLHARYSGRCLRPHRQERSPPRQDAAHHQKRNRKDSSCAAIGIRKKKPAPWATILKALLVKRRTLWPTWPFSCARRSRCAHLKIASSRWACPIASLAARAFMNAPKSRTRWPISAVVLSPDNDLKFERIINTPKRGIGDASIKKMYDVARKPRHLACMWRQPA